MLWHDEGNTQADSGNSTSRAQLRFYRPDWMEGIAPAKLLLLWVEMESTYDVVRPPAERRAVVEEMLRSRNGWRGYVQDHRETS